MKMYRGKIQVNLYMCLVPLPVFWAELLPLDLGNFMKMTVPGHLLCKDFMDLNDTWYVDVTREVTSQVIYGCVRVIACRAFVSHQHI